MMIGSWGDVSRVLRVIMEENIPWVFTDKSVQKINTFSRSVRPCRELIRFVPVPTLSQQSFPSLAFLCSLFEWKIKEGTVGENKEGCHADISWDLASPVQLKWKENMALMNKEWDPSYTLFHCLKLTQLDMRPGLLNSPGASAELSIAFWSGASDASPCWTDVWYASAAKHCPACWIPNDFSTRSQLVLKNSLLPVGWLIWSVTGFDLGECVVPVASVIRPFLSDVLSVDDWA